MKVVSWLVVACSVAVVGAGGTSLAEEHDSAPGAKEVALADVLEVAVRQNRDLEQATIDVTIARAQAQSAGGLFDWVLSGSADVNQSKSASAELTALADTVGYGSQLSLSKLFSTGTSISVTAQQRKRDIPIFGADINDPVTKGSQHDVTGSVALRQSLLRGRGSAANEGGELIAKRELDAAALTRQSQAREVIRQVVSAYWDLALAHRDLEIRRGSLDLAKERRRITEASARIGRIARSELTAVDQIIASREEEILAAEQALLERAIELRRVSGLEIGVGDIDLRPKGKLDPKTKKIDMNKVLARAFKRSAELAALAARGDGAEIEVEVRSNGSLPKLDLTVSAATVGNALEFGDAVSDAGSAQGYTLFGQLEFEVPLGNNSAKGDERAARGRLFKIKIQERELRAQIAIAAVRAVRGAKSAAKRIEIGKRVIELAKKNIDAEQKRFSLGRATNFDVLQRQEELKTAELRLAAAQVDYLKAIAFIESLTGTILEKYGIKL